MMIDMNLKQTQAGITYGTQGSFTEAYISIHMSRMQWTGQGEFTNDA